MKRSLVLLVVASLVFAGVAGAAVQKGDTEINLAGSFTSTNGNTSSNDSTDWAVDGFLGYFVTDNIQVGVQANGQWTDTGTGSSETRDWMYGVGVAGKYHFMPTNLWVPYVGAQVNWDWSNASGSTDGLMYGPLAGLRFELNANNDFFVEYQYRLFAGELNDVYDSAHAVLIGIIHQFK